MNGERLLTGMVCMAPDGNPPGNDRPAPEDISAEPTVGELRGLIENINVELQEASRDPETGTIPRLRPDDEDYFRVTSTEMAKAIIDIEANPANPHGLDPDLKDTKASLIDRDHAAEGLLTDIVAGKLFEGADDVPIKPVVEEAVEAVAEIILIDPWIGKEPIIPRVGELIEEGVLRIKGDIVTPDPPQLAPLFTRKPLSPVPPPNHGVSDIPTGPVSRPDSLVPVTIRRPGEPPPNPSGGMRPPPSSGPQGGAGGAAVKMPKGARPDDIPIAPLLRRDEPGGEPPQSSGPVQPRRRGGPTQPGPPPGRGSETPPSARVGFPIDTHESGDASQGGIPGRTTGVGPPGVEGRRPDGGAGGYGEPLIREADGDRGYKRVLNAPGPLVEADLRRNEEIRRELRSIQARAAAVADAARSTASRGADIAGRGFETTRHAVSSMGPGSAVALLVIGAAISGLITSSVDTDSENSGRVLQTEIGPPSPTYQTAFLETCNTPADTTRIPDSTVEIEGVLIDETIQELRSFVSEKITLIQYICTYPDNQQPYLSARFPIVDTEYMRVGAETHEATRRGLGLRYGRNEDAPRSGYGSFRMTADGTQLGAEEPAPYAPVDPNAIARVADPDEINRPLLFIVKVNGDSTVVKQLQAVTDENNGATLKQTETGIALVTVPMDGQISDEEMGGIVISMDPTTHQIAIAGRVTNTPEDGSDTLLIEGLQPPASPYQPQTPQSDIPFPTDLPATSTTETTAAVIPGPTTTSSDRRPNHRPQPQRRHGHTPEGPFRSVPSQAGGSRKHRLYASRKP